MKCFLTVTKKPLQKKVLLVMKLTSLLILFFTLNVAANGFGQNKINLRVKKTEIGGILRSIEERPITGSFIIMIWKTSKKKFRLQ